VAELGSVRNILEGNCGRMLKYRMGRDNAKWTELADIMDIMDCIM